MNDIQNIREFLKDYLTTLRSKFPNIETIPELSEIYLGPKNLLGKLDYYSEPVNGKYISLSAEDLGIIMKLISSLKDQSKEAIRKFQVIQATINPYLCDLYWQNWYNMLYKTESIFKLVKTGKDQSLFDAFDEAKAIYVNLTTDLVKPVKIEDLKTGKKVNIEFKRDNKVVSGFFQMDIKFSTKEEYESLSEQIAKKYIDYASFFEKLGKIASFEESKEALKELPSCFDINKKEIDMSKFNDICNKANLTKELQIEIIKNIAKPEFVVALYDYSRRLQKLASKVELNVNQLGITEKESLTQRASAVSTVAKFIGVEDIVTKSENMNIADVSENIHGVFEETATGVELGSIGNSDPIREFKPEQFQTVEAKQSIAKLQILDFITGNINRDMNKLFLKFDEKNNLIGVQGIGNKSSFLNKQTNATSTIGKMPSLCDLKVIDKQMAINILSINESMFKIAMMDYNMNEEAIKFAWDRCSQLQKVIGNSLDYKNSKGLVQNDIKKINELQKNDVSKALDEVKITIMDEDDWREVKMEDLSNDKTNNYFKMLTDIPKQLAKPREINHELEKDDYINSVSLDEEYKKTAEQMGAYITLIKDADKTFFKKNQKCTGIVDIFNKKFGKETFNLSGNIEKDIADFVMNIMDVKLVLEDYINNGNSEKAKGQLKEKDQKRLDMVTAFDSYVTNKIKTLNVRFYDKKVSEKKVEKDKELCKVPVKDEQKLATELNNALKDKDNNKIVKVIKNNVKDKVYMKEEIEPQFSNKK